MDRGDKCKAFTFSQSSSAAKSLAVSALSSKFSMSMSSSAMLFVPLFLRMGAGASSFPDLPHLSHYFCCRLLRIERNANIWISLSHFFSPRSEVSSSLFLSHKIFFTPQDCATCKLSQSTCFCCMNRILFVASVRLRRQWKCAVGGQSVVGLQCLLWL